MKKSEVSYFLVGVIITAFGYNIYSLIIVESSYYFFEGVKGAKNNIYIAVYSFTNKELAKELVKKSKEGVDIRIIIDKTSKDRKAIKYLLENGIKVRVYDISTMHAKVMIIDNSVIIGSHNYSYYAFNKNEELSIIINPLFYLKILEIKNWYEELWGKAKPI